VKYNNPTNWARYLIWRHQSVLASISIKIKYFLMNTLYSPIIATLLLKMKAITMRLFFLSFPFAIASDMMRNYYDGILFMLA